MSPNDFGEITIEQCQKLRVSEYLKTFKTKLKEAVLESVVEVLGIKVSLSTSQTRFGGVRYWWACPQCNRRVAALVVHPASKQVGCRVCFGLPYRKQRYKGMVEEQLR